jgi:hypothetical protein
MSVLLEGQTYRPVSTETCEQGLVPRLPGDAEEQYVLVLAHRAILVFGCEGRL